MLRAVTASLILFAATSLLAQDAKPQAQTGEQVDVRKSAIVDPARLDKLSVEELDRLGDQMRSNKEMLQAIDCYRAALRQSPRSAVLYNKIGMSYLAIREYPKARKALDKSIKLDKNYPEAYNNLGAVHYAQAFVNPKQRANGEIKKAIRYYMKAIGINDDYASFHSNLGTAYLDLKEYDRGIAEYRHAYQLDPTIFERNSKTGIAARLSSPEDVAEYNYYMAKLYAENGETDKALQFLAHAMENGYKSIDNVYKDNEFAKLRTDQRFTELMSKRPAAITQ